jgi:pimeloyl-ACP methyl ester carboxylesterase
MSAKEIKYSSQAGSRPHDIFYKEWGDANNPNVLMCVHGLTRNSGDFDYLAQKMEDAYRIACIDMPGRGQSEWLPMADYGPALYLAEIAGLVARLGVAKLDWVGTSMGGFIGMILAAQPNTPIRKLVLNDAGPVILRTTQIELGETTGNDDRFKSFDEALSYLKKAYAPWQKMAEEQWLNVGKHSTRKLDDGTYALAYDPAIVGMLKTNQEALQDANIWPLFEAIQVPILVLHGMDSTVLTTETTQEMKRRNKNVEVIDLPGIGHAPSLMEDDQIKLIRDWLLK